jgi:dihydroflavonol-4-reductase
MRALPQVRVCLRRSRRRGRYVRNVGATGSNPVTSTVEKPLHCRGFSQSDLRLDQSIQHPTAPLHPRLCATHRMGEHLPSTIHPPGRVYHVTGKRGEPQFADSGVADPCWLGVDLVLCEHRGMLTVVTGASGFLGGVLVRALLVEGRQVRCVDLHRGPGLDGLDIEWRTADVLDRASLDAAFDGAGTVYHLAAVISVSGDPTGRVWATNVDGAHNAADAALSAGVRRFVHTSSVHAFDLEAVEVATEKSPRPFAEDRPVYDRSKAAGEAVLRQVIERGLDAVIVNPTGVIGPGDAAQSRMNTVLVSMFQQRMPVLIDGGFDWVDVRDVASSMIAAKSRGRTGENYLLPGHNVSLRGLGAVVERATGIKKPAVTLPMWLARMGTPLAGLVNRRSDNPLYTGEALHALRFNPTVSGAKAEAELGHDPRPIDETVTDMYRWATDQGLVQPNL